jgi:hypothetical protein
MELEYRNGVRTSKLLHEMTPLEAAIQRYEEMAKKHYSLKNKTSNLTQVERKAELKESLKHLETERRHLQNIAVVQSQLDEYRKAGMRAVNGTDRQRDATLTMLEDEKHHPTSLLEKYMRAEAVPKPSPYHTAHHIIPGSGQYRKRLIAIARTHIHEYGIRINDPANGVYLLHKDEYTPHWSMPASRGHLTYHTSDYEQWVSSRVTNIHHIDFLKTELQVIGRLLQQNEPKSAIAKIKQRALK